MTIFEKHFWAIMNGDFRSTKIELVVSSERKTNCSYRLNEQNVPKRKTL